MRSLGSPQYRNILYYYCILTIIKHSIQPIPHITRSSTVLHVFHMCSCRIMFYPPKMGQFLLYLANYYLVNDRVIVFNSISSVDYKNDLVKDIIL